MRVIGRLLVTLRLLLLAAVLSKAQVQRPLMWLDDLIALQAGPAAELGEQQDLIAGIQAGVENWLKLHPDSKVNLDAAPARPWSRDQAASQVATLRAAVEQILKEDPDAAFKMGVTTVNVTASISPLSPVADTIDYSEIANRKATTVAQSIQFLPGVSVDHKSSRNQAGIMIRGFDTRQVPLYLDGIPIYVPYDGYVDLNRFLTSDIAEIEVAKGYSSPLMGPNGLGGVVNLVTREPKKKIEGEASIGTGSGNMLESGLRLGSRLQHFFFQGSLDWLQTDYFPLSGSTLLTPVQPNYHRVNAGQRDERFSGRAGWTPKGQDQYVFSYTNQKGIYGAPPYSGSQPSCSSVSATAGYPCANTKYWKWPYWNKASYYFNSQTGVGERGLLKFRGFYDQYLNGMEMYDDATYSTMNKSSSSGLSHYDDHSIGFSSEYSTRAVQRNVISASFFLKDDTHSGSDVSFSSRNVPTATPWQKHRDQQTSIGILDSITLTSRVHATLGFSADHLNGLRAQDLSADKTQLVPFQVPGICTADSPTSFSSCTDHVWAYNPLASLSYSPTASSGTFFVTFAEKSHFPTLKDRYSYKFNRALPNPVLQPEHSRNWSAGYSRVLAARTVVQVDLFRSDVRDAIENISFPSTLCSAGKGTCSQSINVGKELHQGAEITVRSTTLSRLTLDANYGFLNRSISDASNVFPTGTPKHKTVGTATLRMPWQLLVVSSVRYESGTVTSSDNGLVVPASRFATMDLGGVMRIGSGMSLRAGVKNLFDREYYYQEGFPEAGRNWYLNVGWRF